jgi:hypothetical protein
MRAHGGSMQLDTHKKERRFATWPNGTFGDAIRRDKAPFVRRPQFDPRARAAPASQMAVTAHPPRTPVVPPQTTDGRPP